MTPPRFFHLRAIFALTALVFTGTLHAAAALKPNFLFSDNMVLQRDREVPVWGEADAGEQVRVTLLGKSAAVTAGPDGKWSVKVGPFPAGGPHELVIESPSEKRVVKNVLVGDVWFCSGQSNMWWSVKNAKDGAKEIPQANYPNIRLITIPQRGAIDPRDDLVGPKWSECSPATIPEFSAVAYYFGRSLFQHNNVPVALINSSWGGSAIQSWTSLSSLETNPDLVGITKNYYGAASRFRKNFANGVVDENDEYVDKGVQTSERGWEAPELDDSKWEVKPDVPKPFNFYGALPYTQGAVWFRKPVDIPAAWTGKNLVLELGWVANYDIVYFNGIEVGRIDKQTKKPNEIPGGLVKPGKAVIAVRVFNSRSGGGGIQGFPEWQKRNIALFPKDNKKDEISVAGAWKYKVSVPLPVQDVTVDPRSHHLPTCLFNAMVAPVIPFGIRGVAWYQGEQNTSNAWEYRAQFPLMIRSWREAWGEEIPFLYVQLPNLGGPSKNPTDDSPYNDSWNELRDAQWRGLDEPRTAMIAAIDLGEAGIHPGNKQDVGARLALAARGVALGEKIEYSGPLYAGMKIEGAKIRVKFTRTGGGLVAKNAPDGVLTRFAIAGADRKYAWAEARIEGDTVVVWNDAVPAPVAVSYAWAMNPTGCNLYNQDGLPAAPFRSDDWPMRTLGKKAPY